MKFRPKVWLPVLFVLVIGALLTYIFFFQQNAKEVKVPNFLDSTPLHGETYSASPVNITLNFDTDLAEKSSVEVFGEKSNFFSKSVAWHEGETRIENNGTVLKVNLKSDLPDGTYFVEYSACFGDSCQPGSFSFRIDSSKKPDYQDLRGQAEVSIDMKNIAFASPKIIISPNTKVTWVNLDEVEHFINTETHPAHTYFLEQNSRGLANGQSYSTTFTTPGQYNYHCSAHATVMKASLIVAD